MVSRSQQIMDISRTPVGSTLSLPPGRVTTEAWRDEARRNCHLVSLENKKGHEKYRANWFLFLPPPQAASYLLFIKWDEVYFPSSYQAQALGYHSVSWGGSGPALQLCITTSSALFVLLSLKESSQSSQIDFNLILKGKREAAEKLKMCSVQNSCTVNLWKNILYNGNYDRLNNECHQCDGTMHTTLTVSYSNICRHIQFFIVMKSHLTIELTLRTILRLTRAFAVRSSVRYLNCNSPPMAPSLSYTNAVNVAF